MLNFKFLQKENDALIFLLNKVNLLKICIQKSITLRKFFLKKAFSILMIFATLLPSFLKFGILVDFKINQDFISKVLCINKEKPEMACNGKCYLMKQLKEVENQEEKQVPKTSNERLELVYFYSKNSFNFKYIINSYKSKSNSFYENDFYTSSFIPSIFHPPKHFLS